MRLSIKYLQCVQLGIRPYDQSIIINTVITLKVAGGLIDLPLSTLFSSFFKTFCAAVLMCLIIMMTDSLLLDYSPLARFFIQVFEGALVYALFVLLFRVRALEDVWLIVKEKLPGR